MDIDEGRAAAERLGQERRQAVSEESTTPDLEEITRKNYEAVNRGDIDAVLSTFRPDAVWDASALGLGTYQGVAAIRESVEQWTGSFEDFEIVTEEFRDLGNGVTLTMNLHKGRPFGSIGFVEGRYAAISIWTDGLIERLTLYNDIDEARAAAERLAEERG
jgi:ketosteroid isomerase-like protein